MGFFDFLNVDKFKRDIELLKSENNQLQDEVEKLKLANEKYATDFGYVKQASLQLQKNILDLENKELETNRRLTEIGAFEYSDLHQQNKDLKEKLEDTKIAIDERNVELGKLIKNVNTQTNKLAKSKELISAIQYALQNYLTYEPVVDSIILSEMQMNNLEELVPSVILKLHCMDVKELRKAYRDNQKNINSLLESYSSRYTTKANQAIYKLMVIALSAELQNILYNLKYEKLDKSIDDVKDVTKKYLEIAGSGNQNIVGTLTKFIGEVEYFFINAVKIEYNYYVKKEQARQEQAAIREQMRQEAEERKALEAEKKKIEREESKFHTEIEKIQETMQNANDEEMDLLNDRIKELQEQLNEVSAKKEDISKLANGKAGNVYVISNLGSFGENVFKIGMTRRLDPQDRVNELGDASVPFRFDVHSFIFSDDAVGLEGKLHQILTNQRVNKVNLRKEFFNTTIDELESLINEIEPTAEFNKTMLAEEFRQSISTNEVYTLDKSIDLEFDDE